MLVIGAGSQTLAALASGLPSGLALAVRPAVAAAASGVKGGQGWLLTWLTFAGSRDVHPADL